MISFDSSKHDWFSRFVSSWCIPLHITSVQVDWWFATCFNKMVLILVQWKTVFQYIIKDALSTMHIIYSAHNFRDTDSNEPSRTHIGFDCTMIKFYRRNSERTWTAVPCNEPITALSICVKAADWYRLWYSESNLCLLLTVSVQNHCVAVRYRANRWEMWNEILKFNDSLNIIDILVLYLSELFMLLH